MIGDGPRRWSGEILVGKKPNGKAKGPQRQEWSGICSALISEKACVAAISQYAEGNGSQELLCRENN